MAKSPDKSLAGMDKALSRPTMGTSAYTGVVDLSSNTGSGKTRPRGNKASGDINGPTGHRKATTSNGAQFRITAAFPPPTLPEAGHTQANGRVISSAVNRSDANFLSATADSYR